LYSRENIIEGKEKPKKMMTLAIIDKAKNEKEKEKTN